MTPAQLTQYQRKGWTFRAATEDDHHTGVPYHYLYAMSRRVDEEFSVGHRDQYWDDITEKVLLDAELSAYTDQFMEQRTWEINGAVRAALRKMLSENPRGKQITVTIPLD